MAEKTYRVYKHTNRENGKVYIGITGGAPENRWAKGVRYRANAHFTNAIKKYGWDGFDHEILLDGLTCKAASEKERELIAHYNSTNRECGYNIALGGIGRESVSDETREKMREAHLGERNHNYGKPKSDDVRRKVSESNKKHWSENPRPKGYKRPPEVLQKMSASRTGCTTAWKGGHHKEETRRKIAESNSKKPVLCIETGIIYPSAKVAAVTTGACESSIGDVCNKRRKRVTAGGYHWRFAMEEDTIDSITKDVAPSNPTYFKQIRCVETGVIYCSIAEAARQVNRAKSTVQAACKNSEKTAGGYHWQYI